MCTDVIWDDEMIKQRNEVHATFLAVVNVWQDYITSRSREGKISALAKYVSSEVDERGIQMI